MNNAYHKDPGHYLRTMPAFEPSGGLRDTIQLDGDWYDVGDVEGVALHVQSGVVSGSPTATAITIVAQTATPDANGDPDPASVATLKTADTDVAVSIDSLTGDNQSVRASLNLTMAPRFLRIRVTGGYTGGTSPEAPVSGVLVFPMLETPAADLPVGTEGGGGA